MSTPSFRIRNKHAGNLGDLIKMVHHFYHKEIKWDRLFFEGERAI